MANGIDISGFKDPFNTLAQNVDRFTNILFQANQVKQERELRKKALALKSGQVKLELSQQFTKSPTQFRELLTQAGESFTEAGILDNNFDVNLSNVMLQKGGEKKLNGAIGEHLKRVKSGMSVQDSALSLSKRIFEIDQEAGIDTAVKKEAINTLFKGGPAGGKQTVAGFEAQVVSKFLKGETLSEEEKFLFDSKFDSDPAFSTAMRLVGQDFNNFALSSDELFAKVSAMAEQIRRQSAQRTPGRDPSRSSGRGLASKLPDKMKRILRKDIQDAQEALKSGTSLDEISDQFLRKFADNPEVLEVLKQTFGLNAGNP